MKFIIHDPETYIMKARANSRCIYSGIHQPPGKELIMAKKNVAVGVDTFDGLKYRKFNLVEDVVTSDKYLTVNHSGYNGERMQSTFPMDRVVSFDIDDVSEKEIDCQDELNNIIKSITPEMMQRIIDLHVKSGVTVPTDYVVVSKKEHAASKNKDVQIDHLKGKISKIRNNLADLMALDGKLKDFIKENFQCEEEMTTVDTAIKVMTSLRDRNRCLIAECDGKSTGDNCK